MSDSCVSVARFSSFRDTYTYTHTQWHFMQMSLFCVAASLFNEHTHNPTKGWHTTALVDCVCVLSSFSPFECACVCVPSPATVKQLK